MDRHEIDELANRELDRAERERLAEELGQRSGKDTALALGESLASQLPLLGPAFAVLMNEFIPRRRQERMLEFMQQLGSAFNAMEQRLDGERVNTDSVADVVERVLDQVTRTEADGKRQYYAAAVANTIAAPDIPADELSRMLDALDELRPSHLRLLAKLEENPEPPESFNVVMGGIYSYIEVVMPGIPEEQVRMDWSDLARMNILDTYPSGTMSRQGIVETRGRIKDFGRRFIAFISVPADGAES